MELLILGSIIPAITYILHREPVWMWWIGICMYGTTHIMLDLVGNSTHLLLRSIFYGL